MNRILSILCALTLALGVSATPLFRHQVPQKSDGQKLEQRLKQARTDRERQQLIAKYKQAQRSTQQSTVSRQRSAVKRQTADVNKLTITRVTSTLDRESGSIFYGLHLDDWAPAFYFDIPVEEGERDVELGRTYTLADMNAESCEWDDEEWEAHYYTAATFVKTRGEYYDYHIAATVTDTDGQEWELTYDEQEVIPTGVTVDVNITRPISTQEYITSDQSWLLRAGSGDYFVQLAYYSDDTESPVGEFDASAIIWNDTHILINTGEVDEYNDPITRSVFFKDGSIKIESINDGKRLEVSASLLGDDGNTYAITLFYALPEAESQATLTATDLKVDTWALELWGELNLFAGKADELNIGLNLYPEDATDILTTYELTPTSRHNGYISADGEQFNIYTGSVTLSYDDENAQYVVTGSVLAWNNVEYTLDLRSPLPTMTELTFEGEDLILDIFQGAWQIAGFDALHQDFLSLAVYSASVAGEFTTAQFEPRVTYLAKGELIYVLSTAAITVSYADEIASVTGTLQLINQDDELDQVELTLNIKAHPYQPAEHNVTIADFAFRYYADGPDVFYQMIGDDQQQLFNFDILVEQWNPDVEFGKTYTLDEMIADESIGLNIYENAYIEYESVEFTKATAETEGQITLTVKVIDKRGNTWNLSYTGADKPITEAITVELGQANKHIWADGGIEYEMVDKDNSLSCILVFNLPDAEDVEAGILYDTETILLDYSYLSIRRTEYKLTDATFLKEVDGQETSILAIVKDERGYSYELRYFDDGFVLTGETIQVVMQTPIAVYYDDEYAEWNIHAETDTRIAHFTINSLNSESPAGTFTENEVSIWSSHLEFLLEDEPAEDGTPNWLYLTLHSIDYVTIAATEDGYTLEASVVGDDANVYEVYVNIDPSAVDTTGTKAAATKRIRDGQLLIISGERTYNAQGLMIR